MIDFIFFFNHIMSNKKIAGHYLKKVDISVLSIYHHIKTNSGNKTFILTGIVVTLYYQIRVGIRVTTITSFSLIIIRTVFIDGIVLTLHKLRINISLAFLLAISKIAIFSTLCRLKDSSRHIFVIIDDFDFFDTKCFSY